MEEDLSTTEERPAIYINNDDVFWCIVSGMIKGSYVRLTNLDTGITQALYYKANGHDKIKYSI